MTETTSRSHLPTEVVEARGHLIDSHLLEQIFDVVVEVGGRFEVEEFSIGRTNDEPSFLRLRIEAPSEEVLATLMTTLSDLGCTAVYPGDAELQMADRDRCAPQDFYSTTNQRTLVRHRGSWIEARNQRMDAVIVVRDGAAACRRLRDVRAGDAIVVGMRGVRVAPEAKSRERHGFAFMSSEISSERQVEAAVAQTAGLLHETRAAGKKILAVAGPVVVHTGAVDSFSSLIRAGWIDVLLAGNALAVHDIESALLGTSLGVRVASGRLEQHGHRNHMRAINAIYHAGSIRAAIECGQLTCGVMYECIKHNVPFVLAGSLRDDGPLPETITDMNAAQDAYAEHLRDAGVVLCLSSMLHSIATGNMLPAWVKIVCVDINPAVPAKVSDRGTGQVLGVVTDVGLFVQLLAKNLECE